MRLAKSLLAVAMIGAAVLAPSVADASHRWGNYHWARSANPVSLEIGDNMTSLWRPHLNVAVADWDQSAVLDLTVAAGQSKGRCKATSGRIEVCNGSYGSTGWLGLATISVSGDHITAGTAQMNDTYFSVAPYNTPAWRQVVVCQEIGHDFGLGHQDEDFNNADLGTCMDYSNDPTPNQHPNAHDYDELAAIYGHLDGGSSGGGGGGGGCPPKKPGCGSGAGEGAAPSDWGELVRSEGRTAVYERDFGRGERVITFVIWA